jgi:hypothetical protein
VGGRLVCVVWRQLSSGWVAQASFPHAMALGASFNRTLWGMVGDRISTEARAMHNTGHLDALWLWAREPHMTRFGFVSTQWSWVAARSARVGLWVADSFVARAYSFLSYPPLSLIVFCKVETTSHVRRQRRRRHRMGAT